MYTAEVPDDPEKYQKLCVDGKVFYKVKDGEDKVNIEPRKRRRYSDQFRNPLFIQKDVNRKLKMIKQFREKNGDLASLIASWRDCISECISILQNKYGVSPVDAFKAFNLKKHGFHADDYGICEEDLLDENNCY